MKRFFSVCMWLLFLLIVLLGVSWFSGVMGSFLAKHVLPGCLPIESNGVTLSNVAFEGASATNLSGVTLEIAPTRALALARKSVDYGWLIPPGIFPNGMVLSGLYSSTNLNSLGKLPFKVLVTEKAVRPRLTARLPVLLLNDFILKDSGVNQMKKDDYVFGSYERSYLPTFKSLHLWSDDKHDDRFPITRNLMYEATGKIKFKLDDGPLEIKATGKIKEYTGMIRLDFTRDMDGVVMLYQFTIRKLKINVDNLLSWGDDKISDDLKKSMEKNLNKRKAREKIAGMRLPVFVPYDAEIDVIAAE
jgi:hypothetical protein